MNISRVFTNIISEPELVWSKLGKKWNRQFKTALFTFIFGIIVYIQMITEWLANPDGIWAGVLYKGSYGWEDSLGRIGLRVYNRLKGYFQFPTLQTFLCFFILAIITVLLLETFNVHQQMWGLLLGGLMVCSPYICDLLTYYYTSDAYMIAYLFSVLFVYILTKHRKLWNFILAVFMLASSLTLYQAFLGTCITLCLIYLLYRLIKKGDSWKEVLLQGGYFLAGGGLGTLLYLLAYRLYCNWKNIQPTEARGFASMGIIPHEKIFELIKQTYIFFNDYYFTDNLYNNSWHSRKQCNILVFATVAVMIIVILWKKRSDIQTIILVSMGLMILPLCFMSIVVLAPEVSITGVTGILMLPHMNFIYLFLIVLVAGESDGIVQIIWGKWMTFALSAYLIFILVLYVEIFQNCMRMDLNRNYALAQHIVIQLEELPEHYSGMKIMIGGDAKNGNYPRDYQDWYAVVDGTIAEYGFFWDSLNGRQACWTRFIGNYLGITYRSCDVEEVKEIMSSEEYAAMSFFPEQDSVRMIGDCAVVKLSDD